MTETALPKVLLLLNSGHYSTTVIIVIGSIEAPIQGMVTSGGPSLDPSKLINLII